MRECFKSDEARRVAKCAGTRQVTSKVEDCVNAAKTEAPKKVCFLPFAVKNDQTDQIKRDGCFSRTARGAGYLPLLLQ